jgi:hypothetical protein
LDQASNRTEVPCVLCCLIDYYVCGLEVRQAAVL